MSELLVVCRVSDRWRLGEAGLAFGPGALVEPQPVSSDGGIGTRWTWRGRSWLDGHLAPYPFENHGADGWRWAGRMVGDCIPCGRPVTLVRNGTAYCCAECRSHVPYREARRREVAHE